MITMADLATARAAKAHLRALLGRRDGICGIGLARAAEGYELRVAISRADARDVVPAVVDGIPVRVRVTGALHAGDDQSAARSHEPRRRRHTAGW